MMSPTTWSQDAGAGEKADRRYLGLRQNWQRDLGRGRTHIADHDEYALSNQGVGGLNGLCGRVGIIDCHELDSSTLDPLIADGGLDSSLHAEAETA